MNNLVDPRDATPANAHQRHAIREACRMLGGAPKKRRGTPVRSLHIDQLEAGGIDRGVMGWMHFQGLVTHVHLGKPRHTSAVVGPTSSFTLTDAGRAFGTILLASNRAGSRIVLPMGELTPRYHFDPRERLFTWGVHLLKRFRQHPGNQETILAAFEEQQWDSWVDDPLTGRGKIDPKVRLHYTIRDLNRWQNSYFIHFKAVGSGTAISWELH